MTRSYGPVWRAVTFYATLALLYLLLVLSLGCETGQPVGGDSSPLYAADDTTAGVRCYRWAGSYANISCLKVRP